MEIVDHQIDDQIRREIEIIENHDQITVTEQIEIDRQILTDEHPTEIDDQMVELIETEIELDRMIEIVELTETDQMTQIEIMNHENQKKNDERVDLQIPHRNDPQHDDMVIHRLPMVKVLEPYEVIFDKKKQRMI